VSTKQQTPRKKTRKRGKGRGKQEADNQQVPRYAAPTMPPPWKPEKTNLKASTTAASSADAENSAELAQALREAYPDLNAMPDNARKALIKAEVRSTKQIEADMYRATTTQGNSRRTLHKLQEAKTKHRTTWLKHLKTIMESLSRQMVAYDEQQEDYTVRIATIRKDIQITRRDIQRLNTQAALAALPETPLEDDVEQDVNVEMDQEEATLRKEVNELLQNCLKANNKEPIEIKSEEEDEAMGRTAKRPRSKDPPATLDGDTRGFAGK